MIYDALSRVYIYIYMFYKYIYLSIHIYISLCGKVWGRVLALPAKSALFIGKSSGLLVLSKSSEVLLGQVPEIHHLAMKMSQQESNRHY